MTPFPMLAPCCVLALTAIAIAQDPAPEQVRPAAEAARTAGARQLMERIGAEKQLDPFDACPFAEPRLESADWAKVAWAAEQSAVRPGALDVTLAGLRAALARARAAFPDDPRARAALSHLLFALEKLGAALPLAELELPRDGEWNNLRLCLLLRAPDATAVLFHEWKQSDETSAQWEVLGGGLALRRHATFAVELLASIQPTLRVEIEPEERLPAVSPDRDSGPAALPDFPPRPRCGWRRDDALVEPPWITRRSGQPMGLLQPVVHRQPVPSAVGSELTAGRCRLRWLAYLAGEPVPMHFPRRFELHGKGQALAELPQRFAEARARAEASLRTVTAALVEKKLIPGSWAARVPQLRVAVADHRPEAERLASPLPELK